MRAYHVLKKDWRYTKLAVVGDVNQSGSIVLAATPPLKALGIRKMARLYEIPKRPDIIIVNPIMHTYMKCSTFITGLALQYVAPEDFHQSQYPNFFHWMTARETLTFMGQLSGLKKEELSKSIPKNLEKVGLRGEENSKVGTFSGGMKQRLGIAQALLHKPSLIVMDEPVSALDPIGRRELLNLIEEIKKDTTILLSTHILSDAEEICERFVIIKDGTKIEDTTITELLHRNSENKLIIEITDKDRKWIDVVKKLPYVKDVEVIGLKVKVKVESIEVNKNLLLQNALEHKVDIVKFEVSNDTLEEIFLKLVVQK